MAIAAMTPKAKAMTARAAFGDVPYRSSCVSITHTNQSEMSAENPPAAHRNVERLAGGAGSFAPLGGYHLPSLASHQSGPCCESLTWSSNQHVVIGNRYL